MWALVTLILQMIKFFSISLKLFAVGFDVLVPGECVVAVTKVTLADFQQFIFPSSLRCLQPCVLLILLPPAPSHPIAVPQYFCLWALPSGQASAPVQSEQRWYPWVLEPVRWHSYTLAFPLKLTLWGQGECLPSMHRVLGLILNTIKKMKIKD